MTKTSDSRQFAPNVIAPFSKVILRGEAGFADGTIVAKEFDSNQGASPSQLQMHGDSYKGTIQCKSCTVSRDDAQQCKASGETCYKVTPDQLSNPYSECCDGLMCSTNSIWTAPTCKSIPSNFDYFPDPRGTVDEYVRRTCSGTEHDNCPEALDFGASLSAADVFQGDFPSVQTLANPAGIDNSIAFFVTGDFTSQSGAEIEGKIVVLGDFKVESDGVNSLVKAGVGSQIVPDSNQVVMTGKFSILCLP